jgi:flagellar basal-body rod protein FlgC
MIDGTYNSLSALRAFAKSMAVAANNVANSHTNGYKKSRAVLEEGQNGAVSVSIQEIVTPGVPVSYSDGVDGSVLMEETSNVDLAEEIVNMIIDQRGFEANLKSLKTRKELEEAILNILV